jgi:hypothetical protein
MCVNALAGSNPVLATIFLKFIDRSYVGRIVINENEIGFGITIGHLAIGLDVLTN